MFQAILPVIRAAAPALPYVARATQIGKTVVLAGFAAHTAVATASLVVGLGYGANHFARRGGDYLKNQWLDHRLAKMAERNAATFNAEMDGFHMDPTFV
jgi:hypothetical protein